MRVYLWAVGYISIHALVKRATAAFARPLLSDEISIHALVKRATFFNLIIRLYRSISIHALVKRATGARKLRATFGTHFNPRPREEGDTTGCR